MENEETNSTEAVEAGAETTEARDIPAEIDAGSEQASE